MTAWSLWYIRNRCLWRGDDAIAASVVAFATRFINDWIASRASYQQLLPTAVRQLTSDAAWVRPPARQLKCNVDAAWSAADRRVSFWEVIRDTHEVFVRGFRVSYQRQDVQ